MLLLDRKHLHYAVNQICQFYKTTVLGIHLGPYPVVIVNNSEYVKKALFHRDFDGRPDILVKIYENNPIKLLIGIKVIRVIKIKLKLFFF